MAQSDKIDFQGEIQGIQPRIRLLRSFDQRSHQYLGYALFIHGSIGPEDKDFWIGIGKGAQSKNKLCAGSIIKGECLPVEDQRLETVEFYKVSKLKVLKRYSKKESSPPPWLGIPQELEIYR
jgi:hypothetical protein